MIKPAQAYPYPTVPGKPRVILRDGVNIRGINTAATIWCSAAALGDMERRRNNRPARRSSRRMTASFLVAWRRVNVPRAMPRPLVYGWR
jgi:hypothetical protein